MTSFRPDLTRSRVFRCSSSSATLRLMVGKDTPSLRPAAEKLPSSAADTNRAMASKRSMTPHRADFRSDAGRSSLYRRLERQDPMDLLNTCGPLSDSRGNSLDATTAPDLCPTG